jgi:predicted dehydrogenase
MGKGFNRREFLGLGSAIAAGVLVGCSTSKKRTIEIPPFRDQAPDGQLIKAGLIGCGGRGTGAALNFLNAGPNLKVVALADLFEDRLESARTKLKEKKNNVVEDKNCFLGFDAYKKLLETDVDYVILATPPHFRPMQFAAAVQAKKNVFMEKPVAVDPVGAKIIMSTAKKAQALGLSVGTGTQRRHQRDYVATFKHIYEGAVGDIVGGNCYWNQGQLWYRNPRKEWTEMEYMIRDWVNWAWLSGDHIVEQHVHNIDVINWFTGMHPVKAVAFGARERRVTGNQYDFFSVDFTYENQMHVHSMCRQINGCVNNVSERVQGSAGFSNCRNTIYNADGSVKWKYDYGKDENGEERKHVKVSPYDQEHIDLVTSIRENKPYVEAENTAISTLAAIMGRISAYTGREVTWEEMMQSDFHMVPKKYELGDVEIDKSIPVPGKK